MRNQIRAIIKTLRLGEPLVIEWMDAGYDDNDPISWSNIKQVSDLKEILIKSIGITILYRIKFLPWKTIFFVLFVSIVSYAGFLAITGSVSFIGKSQQTFHGQKQLEQLDKQ